MNSYYVYALAANLSFALGSQIFTHYSRKFSSAWMNAAKAGFALIAFGITVHFFIGWRPLEFSFLLPFLFSGIIGLGLGDVFLLKSFSEMGPGRTMILFGFQPLIIGLLSYFVFGQEIDLKKLWAIVFFISCIFTFSFESFRKDRKWQIRGILIAMTGMLLDAIGTIITRYTFDHHPQISSLEGNFYRTFGAVGFFVLFSYIRPYYFLDNLKKLNFNSKMMVILGAFLGTYLALGFYLKAIQGGHLAIITSISITGTLFASLFECVIHKKWPSIYLFAAFGLFFIGMKILL